MSKVFFFDKVNDAILLLDNEGNIIETNQYAQNILAANIRGNISDLLPHINADWNDLWARYWHTGLGRTEVQLNERVYEVHVSPILNWRNEVASQILILRDITERKNLEISLRDYSEHLEDLVKDQTNELRRAERLAAIGETTAMVGHDLRNPMQVISGIFKILKTRIDPDHENDNLIKRIDRNLKYMDKIVSDLQAYAKQIPVNPEFVDMCDYVNKIIFSIETPEGIVIKNNIPSNTVFNFDPGLFERVLNNLITNSIQALGKGGEITITGYKDDEKQFLQVKDTGSGIPPEITEKIFKPLFTTKAKGTGLGLAVCKRIIEAHDGEISFNSVLGEGTEFNIILPSREHDVIENIGDDEGLLTETEPLTQ